MFVHNHKVTRVENSAAAGTTDLTTDWVDMSGFESITFVVLLGTVTSGAVTSVKVQQSQDSGGSGAADLAGSGYSIVDTASNGVVMVEIHQPLDRYVALILDRGTQNAVLDGILAIQSGAKKLPVTQPATTLIEFHLGPAEGTA